MTVTGVYVVQGELNAVVALLRKTHRWQTQQHMQHGQQGYAWDEQDPLLRNFADLRDVLNSVADLCDMTPKSFLSPFLDVIKSDQTSGMVTGQALNSVAKFLSYSLIDASSLSARGAVESIAEAVTHAKFVGADPGSDEVVLLNISQVLRTLLLSQVGSLLSNESVCEILQSCFRICFEIRLSDLLRKAAEATLVDMIQLLFTRLPTFEEDVRHPYIRKLKMRASLFDPTKTKRRKKYKGKKNAKAVMEMESDAVIELEEKEEMATDFPVTKPQIRIEEEQMESTTQIEEIVSGNGFVSDIEAVVVENVPVNEEEIVGEQNREHRNSEHVVDVHGDLGFVSDEEEKALNTQQSTEQNIIPKSIDTLTVLEDQVEKTERETMKSVAESHSDNEEPEGQPTLASKSVRSRVNQRGVTFTDSLGEDNDESEDACRLPYGLPCVRELFRFLISLINPQDPQNTEGMIRMGLGLLTVALEAGADYLGKYSLLMPLVKNELTKNLFGLMRNDKLEIFALTLRVCFLLFESLRTYLKLQLEVYLSKLMDIVVCEKMSVTYDQKEMTLEALVQLWRIPGLVTELYLNYDCDLYCSNLFEDLTKLLSKNAFPVTGLYSTHILSLYALLTVVSTIESNCVARMAFNDKDVVGTVSSKLSITEDSERLDDRHTPVPQLRVNRHPPSQNIPTYEDLIAQKKQKDLLKQGTVLFNQTPKQGIAMLQENGLLSAPLNPKEVVDWIKQNPSLDKRKIAEYIVNRKNAVVLKAFVQSFNFDGVRLDEALRMFLETFRLPGEAAEISMVIEHFADHWHGTNDEPFHNTDAAFTLAYAVIMLNVDQHNPKAKVQQKPMTVDDFKRNLSGVNGGENFEPEMLQEIYNCIKADEIIMPAEQTGNVRENYLWKMMLRRGATKDGVFLNTPSGLYDHDLFSLVWGPTIAALSFVFDKSEKDSNLQEALSGFQKCATIAAHYGMSDVFDNLIISLCKFSSLSTNGTELLNQVSIHFADNIKAQMAAKAMFQLVHAHGDILREGWKNILDCMLQMYRANMLPKQLTEVEDFVDPKGWITIIREPSKAVLPKSESGLLSSLVLYLGGSGGDSKESKTHTPEEMKLIKLANCVIAECNPHQIVTDSKYLTCEALAELFKALVMSSAAVTSNGDAQAENEFVENALVFYLELMIGIALENRDRLGPYWKTIRGHVYSLLTDYGSYIGSNPNSKTTNQFLVERTTVGLLRLAVRLLFREDVADEVLHSLSMLQLLRPACLMALAPQISMGLHELLRSNAANVHKKAHWSILFQLLETAGAAALPDAMTQRMIVADKDVVSKEAEDVQHQKQTDGNMRRYTSDSELYASTGGETQDSLATSESMGGSGEWLYVEHNQHNGAEAKEVNLKRAMAGPITFNKYSIVLRPGLKRHDPKAFIKCCETLAFLVRDAAHITPHNFESCVQCLRTFVEASLDGGRYAALPRKDGDASDSTRSREKKMKMKKSNARSPSVHQAVDLIDDGDADNGEPNLADSYQQISHQLMDLSHTLHTKAASIFKSWAEVDANTGVDASPQGLWHQCWRPLLQCLARLCCDCRRQVRAAALSYLQRAFVIPDMQSLTPDLWEDCFSKVLFPLLGKLLENISPMDPLGMEETRVRAMTLLCKVFLQHLTPLSSLPTFNALWMTILDFTERYMHTDRSDLLSDSIPESLKNMLRVMDTAGMFHSIQGLYLLTMDRLSLFLPNLMEEVLPNAPVIYQPATPATAMVVDPTPTVEEPLHSVLVVPRQPSVETMNAPSSPPPPTPTQTPPTMASHGSGLFAAQQQINMGGLILHPPTALQNSSVIIAPVPPAPYVPQMYQQAHQANNPLFDQHHTSVGYSTAPQVAPVVSTPEDYFPGVPPEPSPFPPQYYAGTHTPAPHFLADPQQPEYPAAQGQYNYGNPPPFPNQ